MANCEIRFNENNTVKIGVYDKNGNPSKLFGQILNNPHISDFGQAIERFVNLEGRDEQPLQYRTPNGQVFNDFSAALKATSQGDITAFSGETDLFSINSSTDTKSFNGLINNLVKNDLIESETVQDSDGKKLYRPKGDELKKYITSDVALQTARGSFGYAAHKTTAGDLWFDTELIGKRAIENKNGEIEYLTEPQFQDKSFRSFADPVGALAEKALKDSNRAFGDTKPLEEIEIIPENLLQEKLLTLLQQLGIKTVSLQSYQQKYNPDVNALADIANKLIAFKEGKINQEDLTEEVAHFIVEATDPTETENLLRNIHKTAEWAQYEQTYREIYAQEYSAEELEEVVRKEILGKVLANSLQTNFNKNRNSATENTIVGRLQQIFNNFIQRIQNYFKPVHEQQLNSYLDSIYANLMEDNLYDELNAEQFGGKKYVLYSIEQAGISPEYRQYQKTLEYLTNQQYQLAKKYSAPASKNMLKQAKEELEKSINAVEQEIQRTYRLKALTNLATVANSQLNYLSRVIDTNSNSGYHFAQEENSVYQNFMTKVRPMLSQINGQLNSKDKVERAIKEKIQNALNKSLELEAKVPASNEIAIRNIVERVIDKTQMTEAEANNYRQQLTNVLTTAQQDTNWFHAHLGQLVHSQSMLLNLAGDVIAKTVTESRQAFLPRIKQFLNELETAGFDPRQLKKLIDKSGRIINETDNNKLEDLNKAAQAEIYNSITGGNVKPKDFTPELVQNMGTEDRSLFEKQWREVEKQRRESFFTQEYLDKLENFSIEVLGNEVRRAELPDVALSYEQQYRGQLTEIRINNGGINTEGDKYEIQELNKQRVNDSNPRNADGTLKKGLIEVYDENRGQYVVRLATPTVLSNLDEEALSEAQRIYGLQMINLLNREFYAGLAGDKSTEIPESFIDKLNSLETEQEKWDFVQLNAYVGFKPEFWDNFGQTETLAERLTAQKDGSNDREIEELLSDIRAQQQAVANILKGNRVFNRPSETNVVEMSEIETQSIKDAATQLESLYAKANNLLPKEEQVDLERLFESRTNEAYRSVLQNEDITTDEEKISFILKHVTPNNRQAIENAVKVVAKIKEGDSDVVIKKSLQRVFNEDMSAQEAQSALMSYAESKLLPYYKRTEPVGFSEEYSSLVADVSNNVEGAVENYIQNSEYLQINPSYSFYSQNESINPRWIANRDAKRPQYTEEFLQQIRNEEFYSRYGIKDGAATKNLEEWKAREALLGLQDWTLENYDATDSHDRYLLPQQHKTGFRRLAGFVGAKDLQQSVLDIVNFREDETETGQDEQGNIITNSTQILSIPKYGLRKLNEPADVTDELLYSYAWMASQSSLYRSRKQNIGDMLALNDALLNQEFVNRKADSSNAYKMMKSFLNFNYYGIRESWSYSIDLFGKKVDLAKLARVFNNYVRFLNLTGVVVPLTSLIQSRLQKSVEARVEETTNVISSSLAKKEFRKYASGAAAEIMDLKSKNRLNVLGESYGLYDLTTSRFENSNYNKATRTTLQFASGLHALGNFPVLPQVMLSVLMDYRYVGGEIINYNQYKRRNPQVDKKQLDSDWKKLDLFYDDIITKDGVQTYNKADIATKTGLTEEALDARLKSLHETITNRVEAAVQDIDSQISEKDKSIAARDARAAFLLLHSNWLILALTKRFKSHSYDISRETYTEGSWISTVKFLKNMVVGRKDLKRAWKDSMTDELTRRNLRRTVLDLGVANALAVAALLLANYVDDEEDPLWAVAFADYMFTRVANEQISSTLSLPTQLANTVENPIIAADRFFALADVLDVFSGEEITRGNFSGYTERYKYLSQSVPILKDYHRLTNPKRTAQTYRHFNEDSQDYAIMSWFFADDEE